MNKPRFLLTFLLAATLLLLGAMAGFYLLLPSYLEQRLLPRLAAQLGVEQVRGRVHRLGLSGAELRDLTAGTAGAPALSIRTARLEYTIPGLLTGRLARAEIGGLRLRLAYRDGTLTVPGLELPQAGEEEGPGLALPVGRLRIEDGELLLESGQEPLRFPFALSARQDDRKIVAELRIFPRGQELFFQAQADPAAGEAVGNFRTEGFPAASLAAFPLLPPDVHPGGAIDLQGSIRFDLAGWAVSRFTAEGSWRQAMLVHKGVAFLAADDHPLTVSASGTPERWQLAVADFSLAAPRPLMVPDLEVEVVNAGGRFLGSGRFRLRLPARSGEGVILEAPFTAAGDIAGAFIPGGAWQFELKAGPDGRAERASFRINDNQLAFLPRTILLSGQGRGSEGEVRAEALLADVEGKSAAAKVRAPEAVLTGRGETKGSPAAASGEFALRLTGLRAEAGETAATIGRAEWRGDVAAGGEKYQIRSVLHLADSGASLSDLELQATGIVAEIPFAWPSPAAGPQGQVKIADLAWAGTSLGSVTAALRQQALGYRFDVVHIDRLLDDLKVMVAGTASWEEHGMAVEASLSVPPQDVKNVPLERLHPATAGLTLAGGVEAAGDLAMGSGGAAGSLRAAFSRGTLDHPEKKWRIEGIETAITFPALPKLQSAPGQRLAFGRAALGDLLFGKGLLEFRLEEPGSLLIEESEVTWSGGHLRLQGLRLAPGKEEYELVILCEGVRIPDILAQLGMAGVEGQGAVSGRIPLTIREGELRFGEGYLASPPGRGGFLKMKDPGRLAAAIPEAARAGQIDFAMEALRNFEYDQVKLQFGSEGQELILQMQLDGRPAEPLPFTFDRQLGSFVRLKGEGSAGIMQPIRLDLNFRLPLDDLLHYGAGFQQLFEN